MPHHVLQDDEDDRISTSEVYSLTYAHFGNHEVTCKATEMYSSDFI